MFDLDFAYLFETMSKALPVVIVIFSSFGVWLMLSSPTNYKDLSASSSLNVLIVPLGKAIPRPFF
jgi:hypothetical protein